MSDHQREYELSLKVLSVMNFSRPTALATISQKTGIRLAELIRLSKRLEAAHVLKRVTDNGNTFYILIESEYESKLEELFAPPESAPATKPLSSRDAIMKRRRNQRENIDSEPTRTSSDPITPLTGARFRRQKTSGPEPLSAVDLLNMRRSSTTSPRTIDLSRSSTRLTRIPSAQGESPSANAPQTRSGDIFRNPSSTSNKAVFVNHPIQRGMTNSRSTFTATPPAMLDSMFERSDTNFKQVNPTEMRAQMPLIPLKAMPQTNSDVSEAHVREVLGISADYPFLTILSTRPCHDVWKACSALANAGGGVLVLGMRKYVHDNEITYYIKTVVRPEESIKQLLKAFNDRNIISDCPKDPNFIETKEFGRKKVIIMRIDPSQLAPAPLFTARDSFGMRTTNGCYIYRNGEAEHCTEEEIKALWIKLRAGQEEIDWEQTSEQIEVPMERKVKLHLPYIFDDTVRPLSRKECTYGQAIPAPEMPAHLRGYAAKPDIRNRPDSQPLYPTAADYLKETIKDIQQHQEIHHQDAKPQSLADAPKTNVSTSTPATSKAPLEQLIHDGASDRPTRRNKATTTQDSPAVPAQKTLNSLLFAEDICASASISSNAKTAEVPKAESANAPAAPKRHIATAAKANIATETKQTAAPSTGSIPPKLADADRAKLDAIAAPAIQHPRLPTARLCEIAISLCQHACLKPAELAEILNRKLVPIRDRVMPKIKEHPHVHCIDNLYYYIEK